MFVDWLAMTLPTSNEDSFAMAREFFKDFEQLEYEGSGYNAEARVWDMGVHICLPSSALAHSIGGPTDRVGKFIKAMGGHVTRIDLAVIEGHRARDEWVTRVRTAKPYGVDQKQAAPSLFGWTATIGHGDLFRMGGESSARLLNKHMDMIQSYGNSMG